MNAEQVKRLLGRDESVPHFKLGQMSCIAVTGAGGTIGGAICRMLADVGSPVVAIERDEGRLERLYSELGGHVTPILADATNSDDLERAFVQEWHVDHVIHAAAHKHVKACERNVWQACRNNIESTQAVVTAAKRLGARVVLVSTDKAVQPVCVMGHTKRLAEHIALAAGGIVVRLVNVLGSSGSVLDVWARQCDEHRPMTISDPDATRYFISEREAAATVISACGESGPKIVMPEVVSKMTIGDLARRFRPLCFDHHVSGLSPGEKLHEDLTWPGESFDIRIVESEAAHV